MDLFLVVRSSTTLFCGSKIAARWTAGLIVMKGEELEAAMRLGFGEGKNLTLRNIPVVAVDYVFIREDLLKEAQEWLEKIGKK
ncbi:MAG TPA: hypothetical protein GXX19_00825 [Syntrophomonadaceae bacterium]|nr:hypothetical protein [Syntrophomonadaceae bacterium]